MADTTTEDKDICNSCPCAHPGSGEEVIIPKVNHSLLDPSLNLPSTSNAYQQKRFSSENLPSTYHAERESLLATIYPRSSLKITASNESLSTDNYSNSSSSDSHSTAVENEQLLHTKAKLPESLEKMVKEPITPRIPREFLSVKGHQDTRIDNPKEIPTLPKPVLNMEASEGPLGKGLFLVHLNKDPPVVSPKLEEENLPNFKFPHNSAYDTGPSDNLGGSVIVPTIPFSLSSLSNLKFLKMTEHQQQHAKTASGTNVPLAYYSFHMPPDQLGVIGTDGMCTSKGTGDKSCIIPVRPAFWVPTKCSQEPSSTVASIHNCLNVSSTSKSNLASGASTASVPASSSNAISSFGANYESSVGGNSSTNNCGSQMLFRRGTPSNNNSTKPIETNKRFGSAIDDVIGNASSSTPKTSAAVGKKQEQGTHARSRSPPPPSRMVTRSQTAAVRVQSASTSGGHIRNCHPKTRKRILVCGDLDDDFSPRKIRPEMLDNVGVGLDDYSYAKNPAGTGIEFGAVCSDCGAVAVTSVGWEAHKQAHRDENNSCIHCTQVFLTDQGRQMHQQLHRDGQTRDMDDFCECGICGGSFIAIMYLELHLLELHGRESLSSPGAINLGSSTNPDPLCPLEDDSGQQRFRCGICHTFFTHSLNLDCHMALHSVVVSYCCGLCNVAFPTLDPLVTHTKVHRFAGYSLSHGIPVHITTPPVPQRPLHHPVTNPNTNIWKTPPIRNVYQPTSGHSSTPIRFSGTPQTQFNASLASQAMHQSPSLASTIPTSGSSSLAIQILPPAVSSATVGTPSGSSNANASLVPGVPPLMTPVTSAHMNPAMMNYYMMMSLWNGDKTASNPGPSWQNYLNLPQPNVFNYFNPYLLNNNNTNSSDNVYPQDYKPSSSEDPRKENYDKDFTESDGYKAEDRFKYDTIN
ncbi:hypothetical protein SK128_020557 [Halocaridina rubra]|uniref:C2H2-type domain-containing protein n=1 Tax=Halocaridina rubra TaxID=373956 RepID=A0AAN8XB71_HALRR